MLAMLIKIILKEILPVNILALSIFPIISQKSTQFIKK